MPKQISLRPPVKTHGGKHYLKHFIIENFPENYENMTYVEPMCAGASVFLNKNRSKQEVINDIDSGIVSVFKALRDEPDEFIERLSTIKYNEKSFDAALEKTSFADYLDRAVNEYALRRMSRGGMKKAFAWSDRLRGGQPGDVNAWETMLEELPKISERVQGTIMLCRNVFEILKTWDEDDTFFYLDPPYLHTTRSEGATDVYENEMSLDDHLNLIHVVKSIRGKVLISGYASPIYSRGLKGWRYKKKNVPNHSGQGKTKERRLEYLWMNY